MQGGCFTISSLGGIGGTRLHAHNQTHPRSRISRCVALEYGSRCIANGGFVPRLMLAACRCRTIIGVIDGAMARALHEPFSWAHTLGGNGAPARCSRQCCEPASIMLISR